jgi:hypothetical protein
LIIILLLLTALILFVLASIGVSSRFNLLAAGLACVVASMLVPLL